MYDGQYEEANAYCKQAILHYPRIRYTKIVVQLQLAILLTRWFGSNAYLKLKNLSRKLRGDSNTSEFSLSS